MKYEKGIETTIDGKDVYIIDKISLDNKDYIYAQNVVDDDLTDEYFVYEILDEPKMLNDKDTLAKVLQIFVDDLTNEIDMGE